MGSNHPERQKHRAVSERSNKLVVHRGFTDNRHTVFKFCEPATTPRAVLFNGLKDGSYKKPFLIEELSYRSLCFALDGCTQSEMRIDVPDELVSEYTRKMMGFLAFQPRPANVLIIGLGGGSLVKFCYRHLPATHVTAVEIDSDVLALRTQFCVPADNERLTVIQADGADHVAQMASRGEQTDAILVDAYDHAGIASAVVEMSFIENAKRILGAHGIFVMNLVAEASDVQRHVETVRRVFGKPVLIIAMKRGGNLVIFAGTALRDPQRIRRAVRDAERIQSRLGVFFPTLVKQLNELTDRLVFRPHFDAP
jgi:spermidine synthase